VGARKSPLRSLFILLTALFVNGSILALVLRVVPYPGGIGRNVERPNPTNSRSDRPPSANKTAAARDPRQVLAKAEQDRSERNAKLVRDGDFDRENRIELAETETTSRAAGLNGSRERQVDSTLPSEGEQPGPGRDVSAAQEERAKPGNDPRTKALVSYEAKRAQAGDRVDEQKQLASWCDSQGLWDQAKIHWEAVIRLDTSEESARRRLGYRPRKGQWILDAKRAEDALKEKAEVFWFRELTSAHRQIDRKDGRDATKKAVEAATRVEFITDSLAVPSLWKVFSGHHKHHRLLSGVLSQIKTKPASEMLATLAVYSFDEKARVTATQALAGRNPDEFIDKLVPLLNHRLTHRVAEVNNGLGGRTRILLIEGQEANYQLLYPSQDRQEAASCFGSFYTPGITNRQAAQQFNEEQSRMARALTDQQIESDKAAVENLNRSIEGLNHRVIQVLSQSSGASLGPDPESWRRWLAERQGKTYQPPESRQKPTLAQVVLPLYSPSYLPVAPAPS
jgi:hypothetical protein